MKLKKTNLNFLPKPAVTITIFLLNIIVLIFIFAVKNLLPPEIPLLYGKPSGEEQLVPKIYLFIPPSLAIVFLLLNLILIKFIKDKFLQYSLLSLSLIITILSTITVLKIISIVGNL